jgi:hypothetical protein
MEWQEKKVIIYEETGIFTSNDSWYKIKIKENLGKVVRKALWDQWVKGTCSLFGFVSKAVLR